MSQSLKYSLLLAGLGALFFIPFLGGVHLFDWDEINFAEAAREMLVTGDYFRVHINYQPFWEKPPLFFWMQALCMSVFGVGEFAARLPNALLGCVSLVVLFQIGKTLWNTRFGLIWAGLYAGSVLPFLYFKSGIIDPYLNLFIFLGVWCFVRFYWKKDGHEGIALKHSYWRYLLLAGAFIGLGMLTKGPVALIIMGGVLALYWVWQRFRLYAGVHHVLVFVLAALAVTGLWFGAEIIINGPWFVAEFTRYQYRLFSTPDAGHGGFPGYHVVVLLVGCFPASVFMIRGMLRMPASDTPVQADFALWMKLLFFFVLVLFSIVQSKIVHYSSMCYFPLTYLAATAVYRLMQGEIQLARWMKAGLWFLGGLFMLATIAMPIAAQNLEAIKPLFSRDPFAMANLEAAVHWSGIEVLPGLFLLAVLIAFFVLWKRTQAVRAFQVLLSGVAVFCMLTLVFFINRIEGYSQNAAIEFFEARQGEDCYVRTHRYKSYAHLFYTDFQPHSNPNYTDKQWLLTGDIDKPAYFVAKIHKVDDMAQYPDVKEIGRKNGFVFFKREAVK